MNRMFQNSQEKNMSFEVVFDRIIAFMKRNPQGNYRLMVGTDSQVHARHTLFITGIVIQNEGKGVWACFEKAVIPRKMTNLHERISYETTLTGAVVSLFTEELKDELINIVLPHIYHGSRFAFEGHLDIGAGKRNKTSVFVKEMMGRIESMGIEPKIKPFSFVASSYANKYTR